MQKIVIATGNKGKLREIRALLDPRFFELIPQADFNFPEAIEDGLSFVENAIKKARHAAHYTGLPVISDDSGLEVDALKGQPGIYSARFAGESASDEDNIQKLLRDLGDTPDAQRGARFRCSMVYMNHEADPSPLICDAAWNGRILTAPSGHNGFGYDPIFYVPKQQCTSAELAPELKNTLSHRGQALRALVKLISWHFDSIS